MMTNRECEIINRWYICASNLITSVRGYILARYAGATGICHTMAVKDMDLHRVNYNMTQSLVFGKNRYIKAAHEQLMALIDNLDIGVVDSDTKGPCFIRPAEEPEHVKASDERVAYARTQVCELGRSIAALQFDWQTLLRG